MSGKRITYKDVAEHADVSVATVSYVLNKGPRPVSVANDLSVVGYDNIASAAFLNPPLTRVHHPKAEIGAVTARTLLEIIKGTEQQKPHAVVVPVTLVVRSSTAAVLRR